MLLEKETLRGAVIGELVGCECRARHSKGGAGPWGGRISCPFLGERRPYNVAGEMFHGRFVVGRNEVSAEDVESRMPPCGERFHHLLRYLTLIQQHPEQFVSQDGVQLSHLQMRSDTEHGSTAVESTVGYEDVAVRIEAEKASESLYGDDGAGNWFLFGNRFRGKRLTESSLPGLANGVSLPAVEQFHSREARDDDRGTKRPLAGHHRQAGGKWTECGGVLPGGTYSPGAVLFLAPQVP